MVGKRAFGERDELKGRGGIGIGTGTGERKEKVFGKSTPARVGRRKQLHTLHFYCMFGG